MTSILESMNYRGLGDVHHHHEVAQPPQAQPDDEQMPEVQPGEQDPQAQPDDQQQ